MFCDIISSFVLILFLTSFLCIPNGISVVQERASLYCTSIKMADVRVVVWCSHLKTASAVHRDRNIHFEDCLVEEYWQDL
jgi:hypothetical protein